ncbi:MAG: hypothetical protein II744_00845, partial [Eubacterium sp.]|nr:hypothetical protein [Eubacterium sp.]
MEKINVVVCTNDTEYKVTVKNKLDDKEFEIIGYSEIEPNAKTRVLGYVPDVVIFVVNSEDIDNQLVDFIEDMKLSSVGAVPV